MSRRDLEVVDAEYAVIETREGAPPPGRTLDIGPDSPDGWSWRTALWIGALVALLGGLVWSDVLELALAGWDTYPLIAASRVESLADAPRVLGAKLMDGRFPGGDYWRPLVHASFAFDYARGGLGARAYHWTDLIVVVAAGVATSWLALALLGRERRLWAALAGALLVAHPAFFELAPLPPRRADSLSLALTLFALTAVARARLRTSFVAAALAFLAACAKETGVLCAVLAPTLIAVWSPAPGLAQRLRDGLRASWPTLLAMGVFLAARTAVLGGLGGGAKASVADAAGQLGRVAARYAQLLLAPTTPEPWTSASVALAFGAAAAALLAWRLARTSGELSNGLRARDLALWLGAWTLALAAITAAAGVYRAWYVAPFVAPLALLAAATCSLPAALRSGPFVRVDVAQRRVASFAALGVLVALWGGGSARGVRWSEVRASSEAAHELCARFDALVTSAAPGDVVELDAAPPQEGASRHGVATRRPVTLREYSLEAYAQLAHPARKVRVVVARESAPTAAPDEVVVVLVGRSADGGE